MSFLMISRRTGTITVRTHFHDVVAEVETMIFGSPIRNQGRQKVGIDFSQIVEVRFGGREKLNGRSNRFHFVGGTIAVDGCFPVVGILD